MKVLLVDIDSKIPNLALMQVSAYRKGRGDAVGFGVNEPDLVYVSCIFKKNAWKVNGSLTRFEHAKIVVGGSGVSWDWLPEEMQTIKPDYDLYPSKYAQGFTTRGCIRQCPFCIVRQKEGGIKPWMHISRWYDDRFDTVMLMDNNILALPNRFKETAQFIKERGLKVLEHGMDIRLLTPELAHLLSELKFPKGIHFAWDNMDDEPEVDAGLNLLRDAGIDLRHKVQVYVLVGYNTTPEQDIYRCQKLKEWGTNAFVMPFKKSFHTQSLARWANRKWLYWSIDYPDYICRNKKDFTKPIQEH
jgi:hypothetical protein